jgi:LPS sulfotransferase NodH
MLCRGPTATAAEEQVPESPSILNCFAEQGVREFLLRMPAGAVLIADEVTSRELEALPAGERAFRIVRDGAGIGDPDLEVAPRIVVWTRDDERARVNQLREQFRDTPVAGLVADVLPRHTANRADDAPPQPAAHSYAIVCAPRTGSYYLCSLLEGLGFGQPTEHLTGGICSAAPQGAVDLERFLERLARFATANDWFGTKLISHVMFEMFESGLPAVRFFDWMAKHGMRVIHLHRRDREAQAVSNFFARHTGVWAVQGRTSQAARPEYDFEGILADWRELRQQEEWLQLFLAHLPTQHHSLAYEDLDQQPAAALAGVVAALTGERQDVRTADLKPRTRKQRDGLSRLYTERFRSELRSRGLDEGAPIEQTRGA